MDPREGSILSAVTELMASVVIPAHNEEAVIERLLRALSCGVAPGSIEIVVVANGCTDATAEVAMAAAATLPIEAAACVRVISIPDASKHEALKAGDDVASVYPRLWVDADIVLSGKDVVALCRALTAPGVCAAGPYRVVDLEGRPWIVRSFYDIWTRLPAVRAGLFGRGVIAMTATGHARVSVLPPVMGDDLAASIAFAPIERLVVEQARVVVNAPRTVGDLLRRRVRTTTSTADVRRKIPALTWPHATEWTDTGTDLSDLRDIIRAEPRLVPKVVVFLFIAGVARRCSARAVQKGDFTTWLRDESSRRPRR